MKEETASAEDDCRGTVTVVRSSEIGMAELPLNVPFEAEVTAVLE